MELTIDMPFFWASCSPEAGRRDRDCQRADHAAAMPTGLREVAGRRISLRPLPAEIVCLIACLAALPGLPVECALEHGAHGLQCAPASDSTSTTALMHTVAGSVCCPRATPAAVRPADCQSYRRTTVLPVPTLNGEHHVTSFRPHVQCGAPTRHPSRRRLESRSRIACHSLRRHQ